MLVKVLRLARPTGCCCISGFPAKPIGSNPRRSPSAIPLKHPTKLAHPNSGSTTQAFWTTTLASALQLCVCLAPLRCPRHVLSHDSVAAAALGFDCCDSRHRGLWLLRADSAAAAALDVDCCDSHHRVPWLPRADSAAAAALDCHCCDSRHRVLWLPRADSAAAAAFDFDCCDSHLQVLWLLRADSEAAAAAALDLDCCDSHLQVLFGFYGLIPRLLLLLPCINVTAVILAFGSFGFHVVILMLLLLALICTAASFRGCCLLRKLSGSNKDNASSDAACR